MDDGFALLLEQVVELVDEGDLAPCHPGPRAVETPIRCLRLWEYAPQTDTLCCPTHPGSRSVRPSAHYFVAHKADWHEISDSLPRFGGESGVENFDA
jgi:hypothetical protein